MSIKRIGTATILAASFGLFGCSGDTDGGSAATPPGGAYSSDNAGSISIDFPSGGNAGVSDILGFIVSVRDTNGAPVENIRVSCDTEQGLALLEPTTGIEQTDGNGDMSGRVGCAAPGSYQIGCRLPVGANKRIFETVRCAGPVPAGFTGFVGAGGGTLGGGSVIDDGGGGVRAVAAAFFDRANTTAGSQIDVVQTADCPNTTAVDPESFTDTLIRFTIVNDTNQTVRFSSYRYTVENGVSSGNDFTSASLGFTSNVEGTEVAGGSTVTLDSVFTTANSGGKFFIGSSTAISPTLGAADITFELTGTTAAGDTVTVELSTAAIFGNYNRCS
jgi:hypothetical protein